MSINVLIVDDDRVVSMTLRRQLLSVGYESKTANTAGEALKLAEHEPFTAIFVDYYLPDDDGIHVMEQLRQIQPQTTLIMTTGCNEETIRSELLKAHLADCQILQKPWSFSKMLMIVGIAARQRE
ncbi:MAG: response regulator [Deltaproteobacteria bacterium]|nr:response regulator [Deltaproteobacteria bacterium]